MRAAGAAGSMHEHGSCGAAAAVGAAEAAAQGQQQRQQLLRGDQLLWLWRWRSEARVHVPVRALGDAKRMVKVIAYVRVYYELQRVTSEA